MSYKVYVDDNFHYMDEEHRYLLGEFETLEEAETACRHVVNDASKTLLSQGCPLVN